MSELLEHRLVWLIVIASATALPIAAEGQEPGASEPVPAQLWRRITPAVDHHQHLFSEQLTDLVNVKPMPRITLPDDLADIASRREQGWNDEAELGRLFADDSLAYVQTWVQGKEEIAARLSTMFASPFRITPVSYRKTSEAASIAGYLTRGEGSSAEHFAHFYLGLDRRGGGGWEIATEIATFPFPPVQEAITGQRLIDMLDEADISRAVVLSEAFWLDSPLLQPVDDVYEKVKAENDWTVSEARRYGNRLVPFCSFNPLEEYARTELIRCADELDVVGLKFSFGTSGVDLGNANHIARVREVFREANRRGLALVVHVRDGQDYGRAEAETFIHELLPAAPDVSVQVAHLWGGEGFSGEALAAYAEAVSSAPVLTRNLYFDVAEVALVASREELELIARRIRDIGVERVLYGSDAALEGREEPWAAWKTFASSVPLTEAELETIAGNQAPYLR